MALKTAVKYQSAGGDRIRFPVIFDNRPVEEYRGESLWAMIQMGDDHKPVITIMQESEASDQNHTERQGMLNGGFMPVSGPSLWLIRQSGRDRKLPVRYLPKHFRRCEPNEWWTVFPGFFGFLSESNVCRQKKDKQNFIPVLMMCANSESTIEWRRKDDTSERDRKTPWFL
jgi:hypothetical protein